MKIINYEKNISIEYFAGNIYYDKQIIMNVENKCFFELNELISVLKSASPR